MSGPKFPNLFFFFSDVYFSLMYLQYLAGQDAFFLSYFKTQCDIIYSALSLYAIKITAQSPTPPLIF